MNGHKALVNVNGNGGGGTQAGTTFKTRYADDSNGKGKKENGKPPEQSKWSPIPKNLFYAVFNVNNKAANGESPLTKIPLTNKMHAGGNAFNSHKGIMAEEISANGNGSQK